MGTVVDYDYIKCLGSMRFRLRRCATEYYEEDFPVVNPPDTLEAWAFEFVFWEPCGFTLKSPFSYDFFRVWLSSKNGIGSIVDCHVPVLNSSRSVDVSDGKWMVALDFHTPIRCEKLEEDQPNSMVLACPVLVDSEDRRVLGHLGKTYRTGEESMFGQKYSIKPASLGIIGHEQRVHVSTSIPLPSAYVQSSYLSS
jgi:peptide methionine sulfoxide reductase MsrB